MMWGEVNLDLVRDVVLGPGNWHVLVDGVSAGAVSKDGRVWLIDGRWSDTYRTRRDAAWQVYCGVRDAQLEALRQAPGPVWVVRHRTGWCAAVNGEEPEEGVTNVATACGMAVCLPGGIALSRPDCPDCLAALAAPSEGT